MVRNKQCSFHSQRGISLTGLIVGLALLGAVGVLGSRLIPAYIEYSAIKNGIAQAKAAGGSVRQMQTAFNRTAEVNDITSIRAEDLVITRDGDGGSTEVSFAYEKRIPVAGNVSLLIDFSGTTDPSGEVAALDDSQPAQASR